jgi:hypothetical protein
MAAQYMGKMIRYALFVVLAAATVYAADEGGNTSPSTTTVQKTATTPAKQGVAKVKIIIPSKKTNWSKIKDLFM